MTEEKTKKILDANDPTLDDEFKFIIHNTVISFIAMKSYKIYLDLKNGIKSWEDESVVDDLEIIKIKPEYILEQLNRKDKGYGYVYTMADIKKAYNSFTHDTCHDKDGNMLYLSIYTSFIRNVIDTE
jgi:hypothetical protein